MISMLSSASCPTPSSIGTLPILWRGHAGRAVLRARHEDTRKLRGMEASPTEGDALHPLTAAGDRNDLAAAAGMPASIKLAGKSRAVVTQSTPSKPAEPGRPALPSWGVGDSAEADQTQSPSPG